MWLPFEFPCEVAAIRPAVQALQDLGMHRKVQLICNFHGL